MSVLPEYFDPNQFVQPDYDSHFTIKRPYTTFSKSMILKFEEYNVSLNNLMFIRQILKFNALFSIEFGILVPIYMESEKLKESIDALKH